MSKYFNIEAILQIYVIAGVISTSGLDVLLLLTVFFLALSLARQQTILREGSGSFR